MNGFVHVMYYANSIFHVMVSDGLAAAVEQVDLHGHDVNGFVYVVHYVNSIFHVMVSDGLVECFMLCCGTRIFFSRYA